MDGVGGTLIVQDFIKFPIHLIMHPFDGFWDLKFEERGKFKVATIIVLLMILTMIIQWQFSGFLVNYNDIRYLNIFDEVKLILVPFILWCVANWSLTTLMDGEGKFRDIVLATSYSLVPLIIVYLISTLISNVITLEEASLYHLLNSIAILWFIWLMVVGSMTIHQYSPSKTMITMFLTLIAMGIIIFLGLLFFSLVQQIIDFIVNLYQEFMIRE
jgi:hypothetical protein